MKIIKIISLAVLSVALAGCPGSVTLEEGGVYKSPLVASADLVADGYMEANEQIIAWAQRNPYEVQRSNTIRNLVKTAQAELDGEPKFGEPFYEYTKAKRAFQAGTGSLETFEEKMQFLRQITSQITAIVTAKLLE
jgi:hypothetical protein